MEHRADVLRLAVGLELKTDRVRGAINDVRLRHLGFT